MTQTSAHIDTYTRDRLPPRAHWPDLRFTLPELAYPPRLNCAAVLVDRAVEEGAGHRPAIRQGGDVWSYARLRDVSDRLAGALLGPLGLVPGNRVLLRGANSPWLFAAWLAIMKAGGVAVPTMPLLRAGELAPILLKAQARVVLCEDGLEADLHAALASPALRDLPPPTVVGYGPNGGALARLMPDHRPVGIPIDTAQDDVCLLAFTSGSTGEPKACAHFHRDVLAMADTFGRHILRADTDAVFTGTPPIAFTFGLGGLLVFPLMARACVALPLAATPAALAEAIRRHAATTVFTSPTGYRALLARERAAIEQTGAPTGDLASIRQAVSAGEPLSADTWQAWFDATGVELINGIGSTEMIHIFLSSPVGAIRPGATGTPVPGYEVALLDRDGHPLEGVAEGLLAVRGPVGCRYLDDPRQLDYVVGGWNVTGDTFRRDADGYYWFVARNDDIINSGGHKIVAQEVEQAVLTHPDVADCAVIGVPDAHRGQIAQACVVAHRHPPADQDALTRAIQAHVKNTLAPHKYPRRVVFLESLPRTANGKIRRGALALMTGAAMTEAGVTKA